LTAAGWFSERRAHGAAAPGATLAMQQRSRRIQRQYAERYLEGALRAEPAAAEAALRLARLDVTAGRDADATRRLTALLARPDVESSAAYVGRLLLGGIQERQGETAAAARTYREALALDEVAQSARVALSALLYTSGDAEAAAAVVEPLVTRAGPRQRNDPWADYQLGYLPVGRALLEELRNEVRR
jgi:Flp pilus assembly protein TadD